LLNNFALDLPKEKISNKLNLKITKYKASEGDEYFLQFINKDNILFGLCRLRIFKHKAFIRELHIYGKTLAIGKKSKFSFQHQGLGKALMKKAEEICKNNKVKIRFYQGDIKSLRQIKSKSQDIVFVTHINKNATGYNNSYDFEMRLPAKLRQYKAGVNMVSLYAELN